MTWEWHGCTEFNKGNGALLFRLTNVTDLMTRDNVE